MVRSATTTRVLLARHGESEWNALGRWQGQADPPLSDLGRHQAKLAARSLAGHAVDAIWASDLRRASETAAIIAAALDAGTVVLDEGFRERDAGEWSGLTRAEIEARYPGYLDGAAAQAPAGEDYTPKRPPGWEPDASLLARALGALGRVHASAASRTVLVVTHGGLIYTLERHLDAAFSRLANLQARWVVANGDGGWQLGERTLLVDYHDAAVTVPDQL